MKRNVVSDRGSSSYYAEDSNSPTSKSSISSRNHSSFIRKILTTLLKVIMILMVPYLFISSPIQKVLDLSHKLRRNAFILSSSHRNVDRKSFENMNNIINITDQITTTTDQLQPVKQPKQQGKHQHQQPILDQIYDLFIIGQDNPDQLIAILNNTNPFGTKISDPYDFICEDSNQLPQYINRTKIDSFKSGKIGYYVFFQHLRKAGGTSFCELARSNMERKFTPPYYCMLDNKGSLATPPWDTNNYLSNNIIKHNYHVVANEWDVFYRYFLDYPGAVFATTIRNPLDRWYSQYRFEHVEHRDGSLQDSKRIPFFTWYKNTYSWTMGTNYYVKTFIGEVGSNEFLSKANKNDFYWTYHKYNKQSITWSQFSTAVDHLCHFSLILVLEWIQTNATLEHIYNVLGWKNPVKQVLPHEVQAIRSVKKSLSVQDVISKEEYMYIARQNVHDLLFYEVAKRIFLERIKCGHD